MCNDPRCAASTHTEQELYDKQMEVIMKHGHQVMGIFADPETGAPPFCYTAGRSVFEKAELLIVGPLDQRVAMIVLNKAAEMIDDGEITLPVKGKVTELASDTLLANFKVRIVECDPRAANMHGALRLNRSAVAYQIVWPDMDGNWPGESDYDAKCVQPIYQRFG